MFGVCLLFFCQASFLFSFVFDVNVYLFNILMVFDSVIVIINGVFDFLNFLMGNSVFFELFGDMVIVCLIIWMADGCMDIYCEVIYVDFLNDFCVQIDCVWLGDVNGDCLFNIYDLVNIGLGYGSVGFEWMVFFDFDNFIVWVFNFSDDWQEYVGVVDFKYLDCDGDGFIDEWDVDVINFNYMLDNVVVSVFIFGVVLVYLEFDQESFIIDNNILEYFFFSVGFYVGDVDYLVENFYSISLNFDYLIGLIVFYFIMVDYNDDVFFGYFEDLLIVWCDFVEFGQGWYDLAWSQKSGLGSSGYSCLAMVNFIVSVDIIMGCFVLEILFLIQVNGVYFIDVVGDMLDFDLFGGDMLVIYDQMLVNNEVLFGFVGKLEVFLNFIIGKVYFQLLQGSYGIMLEVLDVQGRLVWVFFVVLELFYVDFSYLGVGLFLFWVRLDDGCILVCWVLYIF